MLEEILTKEKEIATRIERAHADAQAKIAATRNAVESEKESREKEMQALHVNAVEEARNAAEQEAQKYVEEAVQETKTPILSQDNAIAIARKILANTQDVS
jgi:vacuolar-type H+-ATPase subunit H